VGYTKRQLPHEQEFAMNTFQMPLINEIGKRELFEHCRVSIGKPLCTFEPSNK
jgi:hypothetical protein